MFYSNRHGKFDKSIFGVGSTMGKSHDGDFAICDDVIVDRHGLGKISGVGCCGYKGKVEVTSIDATKYHVSREHISRGEFQYGY